MVFEEPMAPELLYMIILNSVYPPGPLWLLVIALGLKNSPNPNSGRYLLSSHPELSSNEVNNWLAHVKFA